MEPLRHCFAAMSCALELQVFAPAELAARACRAVEDEVRRIEAKYSRYRADSLVGRINAAAGGAAVAVDEETAALLDFAATCHRTSGGLFDITSGALRQAWKFETGRLPTAEEIAAARTRIGWDKLRWEAPLIGLPLPGMEIDLGGLGKEYAADRAAALLLAHGCSAALVNFGGDVCATGPRPDGTPWQVGIRHPRRPGELLATLPLHRGGLATSGDYERGMTVGGRRYGHLLNPLTGWPAEGMACATVLADTCLVAGALASCAMLHGAGGLDFLAGCGAPYLAMDANGGCAARDGDGLAATADARMGACQPCSC